MILPDKKLKNLIITLLSLRYPLSIKKIYNQLKKQFALSITYQAVFKAIKELEKNKIITNEDNEYSLSVDWLNKIDKFSDEVRQKYIKENKIIKTPVQKCSCQNSKSEGFCINCKETVCKECAEKTFIHINCNYSCRFCSLNKNHICEKCFKPCCNHCSREIWLHKAENCAIGNQKFTIGLIEVDHPCWFADLSEKVELPVLNTFIDKRDKEFATHSGIVTTKSKDKREVLKKIFRHRQIVSVKPIYITKDLLSLRTRALFDKSVEQLTKQNDSILLNPIIADNTKENNIIISKDVKEMQKLVRILNENGKARIVMKEETNLTNLKQIGKLSKWLKLIDKKELENAVHKFNFINSLEELQNEI